MDALTSSLASSHTYISYNFPDRREDPDAWRQFRGLLDGSGIEPPDTELLARGEVIGLTEARVREQIATALEETIEDGRLSVGAPAL